MYRTISIFGLLLISFIGSASSAHEFYVSMTTLHVNEETKSIEVEIKVTAHDLEKQLKNLGYEDLKLGSDKVSPRADEILKNYFSEHLQIWVNGQKKLMNYVGYDIHLDENLFIYFEFSKPKKIKNIKTKNTILLQTFPIQQNVLHIHNHFNPVSFTFTKNKTEKVFRFTDRIKSYYE